MSHNITLEFRDINNVVKLKVDLIQTPTEATNRILSAPDKAVEYLQWVKENHPDLYLNETDKIINAIDNNLQYNEIWDST